MKKSTNAFTKKEITKSLNSWAGDNITASNPFDELLSGTAPGVGEAGGIEHFKNVTQTAPTH
mgnify:CR=1 FL=1